MIRFSAPASDLVTVLQDGAMQNLVELYSCAKSLADDLGGDEVDEDVASD
jgi:hypothetical protein